ncbi:MAG TPA: hemerythrin domain-containing protein [Flavisolibacter sp.]|jgi:hemerythrin-like domain-containing protein|nr:hemerythrin domain-containing protein [Flavisolibacter sp.]
MRYNMFNQIHKGLRALLYDTALLLQRTDLSDSEELRSATDRVKLVADLFDDHAEHEDSIILPAIQQFEPSLVDAFEQEHVADAALSRDLRDGIIAVQMAEKAKAAMFAELNKTFIQFMIFNLNHMAKEEAIINKVLWRYYSDEELLGLQQKIVQSLTPWSAMTGSSWMLQGLNNTEISKWLQGVERTAPAPVYQQLRSAAECHLPETRFRKVVDTLEESLMIA